MCVVSMVMDHYTDRWKPMIPSQPILEMIPQIPQADIDEFYKLLERAREYDRKNGEPDCELEEKKEAIRKIAKQLGVEIELV